MCPVERSRLGRGGRQGVDINIRLGAPQCVLSIAVGGPGTASFARPKWAFSKAAAQVIFTYMHTFPVVFAALERLGDDEYQVTPDHVGGLEVVEQIQKWVSQVRRSHTAGEA